MADVKWGTYDGPEDDVIVVRDNGRAGLLPRRARLLLPELRQALVELERLSSTIEACERQREELLPELRAAGVSWSLLAWAMNLSEKGVKYRIAMVDADEQE